jgi:hypothetical protein
MNENEVNTAFEILLGEIEEVFNIISKEGEEAFKTQDFDKARSLIEYGERLKSSFHIIQNRNDKKILLNGRDIQW